uniref:NADH-ubiquinone oxidoreductase chain 3 n=1 Tax=Haemadipsa crenata TaxID=933810 RepID=A0A8E5JSU3_9ANNE|nr:NADH dehydrogenase subunit 3 [Haemadipsa crenata]QVD39090.1 NADH dehydrogenase subunit 3 [Haemadipsa crenata]
MKYMLVNSIICISLPMFIYFLSYYLFMRELKNRHKLLAFECGFDSFFNARVPFSTRFFLLAVIFIVFDIEIVLLFPIPMLNILNNVNLVIILMIFFLLLFGLLHEWNEGAIDWMK